MSKFENAIDHHIASMPAPAFKWRDREGIFHAIDKMETRHLFYTLCMIWNHSMPEEAATHEYKRYSFSAFYTPAYMEQAIKSIMPELFKRKDLQAGQLKTLEGMAAYALKNRIRLTQGE